MTVTNVLQEQAGIQYGSVTDKSEADPRDSMNNVLFTGEFKRGCFDQPMKVLASNIRAVLGYDPDNMDYVAVEDALATGAPFVWVQRVVNRNEESGGDDGSGGGNDGSGGGNDGSGGGNDGSGGGGGVYAASVYIQMYRDGGTPTNSVMCDITINDVSYQSVLFGNFFGSSSNHETVNSFVRSVVNGNEGVFLEAIEGVGELNITFSNFNNYNSSIQIKSAEDVTQPTPSAYKDSLGTWYLNLQG